MDLWDWLWRSGAGLGPPELSLDLWGWLWSSGDGFGAPGLQNLMKTSGKLTFPMEILETFRKIQKTKKTKDLSNYRLRGGAGE